MTAIAFYHLTATPLERALPKLLEKAYGAGLRCVVRVDSAERVEYLNNLLWTYDPGKFLPHGSAKDGGDPSLHPIFLTHEATLTPTLSQGEREQGIPPNHATVLFITDGSTPESFDGLDRLFDIFDGQNDAALTAARARWKAYKDRGLSLVYHRQTDSGGWEKLAEG